MSIEENKKIVTEFWKRFSALDLDGVFAMVTDDFTWWVGGDPARFPLAGSRSKTDMRAMLDGLALLAPKGVTVTPQGVHRGRRTRRPGSRVIRRDGQRQGIQQPVSFSD